MKKQPMKKTPQASGEQPLTVEPQINDDVGHLENITAPQIEEAEEILDDVIAVPDDGEQEELEATPPMGIDAFRGLWEWAFALPSTFDSDYEPLKITADKKEGSDAAASLTYDMLGKHFPAALQINENINTYLLAGGFLLTQVGTVKAIQNKKRFDKEQAAQESQPAEQDELKFSSRMTPQEV